jgi:hypothetical protein
LVETAEGFMRAAGLVPKISDDLVATLTYASREAATKAILAASESYDPACGRSSRQAQGNGSAGSLCRG